MDAAGRGCVPGDSIYLFITGTGWPCIPWTAARPAAETYSFQLK